MSRTVRPQTRPVPGRRLRRTFGAGAAALALAAVATACPPLDPGTPTTTSTTTTTVPATPAIVVSATSGVDPAGETLTVTGTGFDPAAHVGTRPPLAGQPSGVYVTFGKFASDWKPSEGAPSSARKILSQVWVLPQASYDALGGAGTPGLALLHADGSFSVEVDAAPSDVSTNNAYGVAVYPGSGAVNPAQELLVPVTFAPHVTVSATTDLEAGDVVTVEGVGFLPSAPGTRPPFAGEPSGVYATFGRFAEVWRPSEGAPSSSREVISQKWALPQAAYDALGGTDALALIHPDGSFSTTLVIDTTEESTAPYAFAVYPGSGAVNPAQELLVPATFAGVAAE